MLASVFATNFGSNMFAASGAPNYLLGNLSNANLTASQVSEFSDKVANYNLSREIRWKFIENEHVAP